MGCCKNENYTGMAEEKIQFDAYSKESLTKNTLSISYHVTNPYPSKVKDCVPYHESVASKLSHESVASKLSWQIEQQLAYPQDYDMSR
ncbi:hypothetical protein VNO80_27232 [Phaseolus coccineus]|uniref:Uncharacterized protein n=1 Tax=Phaseolus coccineus TaxID=3886 RepID=A0AAN9LJN4_PHACN